MRRNSFLLVTIVLVAVPFVWVANAYRLQRDISGPRPGVKQVLHRITQVHYRIVIPHRTLLDEVKLAVEPTAEAGGTCDGTAPRAVCNPNCTMYCYCPDCVNGPCTPYGCMQVGGKHLCTSDTVHSGICTGCLTAQDNKCTIIP